MARSRVRSPGSKRMTKRLSMQRSRHSTARPTRRDLAHGAPVSLPLPEIQIFGGGAHAGRRIDIQDLMVMPLGAESFAEALAMTAETYYAAGALMQRAGKLRGVADE